ncbi:element excision factor XisI family protein [Thiothrix fructosivorans]|uniref:XisI protein n=1 Tax=Thiothrix fructosivorans TaxID=111770 RepID=A0A8B0SDQ3_9GAMM|nr:element excision factor XisI family protein [Thiothrix fructosivorans]MBO0614632.1 XisI protein [Thiothrix fructosivorans]QTX09456.1 XisI protein [Thiothrix fructosivorans]
MKNTSKINGKVWLQHNGTEGDIAQELMAGGVAREDIRG